MAKDTITLALNGDVTINDFSNAIREFSNLVKGISIDVASGKNIEWVVVDLEAGSATATIKGVVEDAEDIIEVEKCVDEYIEIGRCLRERKSLNNYSSVTQKAANNLSKIMNGRITSVRFENPEDDVELFKIPEIEEEVGQLTVLEHVRGAVKGRVDSMTKHTHLRFTLYDLLDNRAIPCYLVPDSIEIMREAWGKIVLVEGIVHRDPDSGRATTVRNVHNIKIIRELERGAWRKAIGAARGFLGDELPEEVIRRSRDD